MYEVMLSMIKLQDTVLMQLQAVSRLMGDKIKDGDFLKRTCYMDT